MKFPESFGKVHNFWPIPKVLIVDGNDIVIDKGKMDLQLNIENFYSQNKCLVGHDTGFIFIELRI